MNDPERTPDPQDPAQTPSSDPVREESHERAPLPSPGPPEQGSAHGLTSYEQWWALLLGVLRTYPRTLVPLAVAAGLPFAPLILLGQPWDIWLASDSVVVDGVRRSFVDPLVPGIVGAVVLLVLVSLAVLPVTAGAATLIAATALLGRRIGVRDAWKLAIRRYGTGLVWVLLSLTLIVLTAAAVWWVLTAEWHPVVVGLLFAPLFLTVWTPLMVMLPVALTEGRGPWSALGRAWRIGMHRRRLHIGLVLAACVLLYLSRTGTELALLAWTPLAEGAPGITAAQSLASLVVTPLALLLLSAPVAFHGAFHPLDTEADRPFPYPLELERVHTHVPATLRPDSRTGAGTAVLVAAALILPPLVAPAVVAADPFGSPRLSSAPAPVGNVDDHRVTVWAEGDRTVLSYTGRTSGTVVCDPECTLAEEDLGHYGFGPLTEVGDEYVQPLWREYEHELDEEEGDPYAPHEDSGLYLRVCEEPGVCEDPGIQVRPFGDSHHDTDAVLAPLGDGLVVVSHVRSYGYDEVAFAEEGDTGGLRAHVCADTACTDPVPVDLPEELSTNAFLNNGHHLDVAPVGEGFLLTVVDAGFGSVHTLYCADTTCAEPQVTELVGDGFTSEDGGGHTTLVGARIRARADGTAVIVLREAGDGAVRVLDCRDAGCADHTEETVTGPGWMRPVPGFDLDSQDRPQLLTQDLEEERMVLLSCLDRGCTEIVRTPLVGYEGVPRHAGLALDEQDRPHLAVGEGDPRYVFGGHDVEATHLRCEDPWCGADLGSEADAEQAR